MTLVPIVGPVPTCATVYGNGTRFLVILLASCSHALLKHLSPATNSGSASTWYVRAVQRTVCPRGAPSNRKGQEERFQGLLRGPPTSLQVTTLQRTFTVQSRMFEV